MAREANSRDPKAPREIVPPPKSFFRGKARAPAEVQKAESVPSSAVAGELRTMGKGWDAEAETLLGMPERMFRSGGEGATYFSDDENFGVSSIASGLRLGRITKPQSRYGICIYDTSSSVYFVLLDMERRIIVRERLFCAHDDPPEKDWATIKNAIRIASAAVSGKAESVAIFDGNLKVVPLSELGEGNGP